MPRTNNKTLLKC